jgi:hypothetical protein
LGFDPLSLGLSSQSTWVEPIFHRGAKILLVLPFKPLSFPNLSKTDWP